MSPNNQTLNAATWSAHPGQHGNEDVGRGLVRCHALDEWVAHQADGRQNDWLQEQDGVAQRAVRLPIRLTAACATLNEQRNGSVSGQQSY